MNWKNKVKKLMGSSAFVLCMAFAVFFTVFRTEASEETDTIKYEQRKVGAETVPTMEGYLFGGWYTEENNENSVVTNPKAEDTYYAKFVPEGVLGIKAQVSNTILGKDSTAKTAAIRFVTTIDSLKYKKIGFLVQKGEGDVKEANVTNTVYTSLYQVTDETGKVGKAEEVSPTRFDAASKYFKTYTIKNVPDEAYNTDITVTPYWITLDGTRVEGTKSIKTVNLGRSWVYINNSANADTEVYGTYDHPFTTLDKALEAVNLENGKVIIKTNGNVEVQNDFTWKEKEVDGKVKVRTITIAGENGETETLDFSAISELGINDNVTFDNMTLKFAKSNVYANGHHFVIKENVISQNSGTDIYGGGNNVNLSSGTNVEIHSGRYKVIWGGNKDGGIINGDIHVTLTNTDIFHESAADTSRVFGGGYGESTINGDIYVTVGQDFNKSYKQPVSDYKIPGSNHTRLSTIYGAGAGGEIVNGNTYVTIQDNAKVDYVYGGGSASSGIINGTCHVKLDGGIVFSIYGGAMGDTAVTDETKYRNKDTSVKVNGGEVYQIIGGNGSGMAGNTCVEISGGTVHRRIYGGCYNNGTAGAGSSVIGTTTVVINKTESLKFDVSSEKLQSGDSSNIGANEVKTLIFNDVFDKDKLGKEDYHYLVTKTGAGTIAAGKTASDETLETIDGNTLQITPASDKIGTITVDNGTSKYFQGAGKYILAKPSDNSKKSVVVNFEPEGTENALADCEARIDGIYYDTLEDAVAAAKLRKDIPAVTLRKDVTIEESLTVTGKQNITLQSEEGQKYTVTGTDEMKTAQKALCLVSADGEFAIQNLVLSNAYQGLHSSGVLNIKNVTIDGCKGADVVTGAHGIYVDDGNLNATGIIIQNTAGMGLNVQGTGSAIVSNLVVSGTNQQGIFVQGTAKVNVSDFSVEDTGMAAVRLMGSANVILENTVKPISTNSYGIYISDTSTLQMTNVEVERKSSNANTLVVVEKGSTITMAGTSVVDGKKDLCTGRGVEVQGTFNLNGGTIKNNKLTASTNGAFLSNTAGNRNDGAGVYVVAGGTFTMNGGSIEGNETFNTKGDSGAGAGVSVNGEGASFELTGAGTIQSNTAAYGAVMVRKGTFNMSGGTITGNQAKSDGGGVVVSTGTFTMSGGTINNNTSTKTGGGVYMNNADGKIILAENGTGKITGNTATTHGGGIHIFNGTFTMNGNTIFKNKAAGNDGGGVYVTGGTFTLNGGTISNNTAKAAGGGVSVNGQGAVFTIKSGTIQANEATNGGAVIVRSCKSNTFTMAGGIMKENNVTGNGGAIYLPPNIIFTMNGGDITGNKAKLGGAIFVQKKGGSTSAATIKLYSGIIKDNTATTGNGICGESSEEVEQGILEYKAGFDLSNGYQNIKLQEVN